MTLLLLNDYLQDNEKHIVKETEKYSFLVEKITLNSFREKAADVLELALLFANQPVVYSQLFKEDFEKSDDFNLIQKFQAPVLEFKEHTIDEQTIKKLNNFLFEFRQKLVLLLREERENIVQEISTLNNIQAKTKNMYDTLKLKVKSPIRDYLRKIKRYFVALSERINDFQINPEFDKLEIRDLKLLLDSFFQKKREWQDVCFLFLRIFVFLYQINQFVIKKKDTSLVQSEIQYLFEEFVVKALPIEAATTAVTIIPSTKKPRAAILKVQKEMQKAMQDVIKQRGVTNQS